MALYGHQASGGELGLLSWSKAPWWKAPWWKAPWWRLNCILSFSEMPPRRVASEFDRLLLCTYLGPVGLRGVGYDICNSSMLCLSISHVSFFQYFLHALVGWDEEDDQARDELEYEGNNPQLDDVIKVVGCNAEAGHQTSADQR